MVLSQLKNGRVNISVKGRKTKLTLTKKKNYVIITPFLNSGPAHIKRWKSPFQMNKDDSLPVRNHQPLTPKKWTNPFPLE